MYPYNTEWEVISYNLKLSLQTWHLHVGNWFAKHCCAEYFNTNSTMWGATGEWGQCQAPLLDSHVQCQQFPCTSLDVRETKLVIMLVVNECFVVIKQCWCWTYWCFYNSEYCTWENEVWECGGHVPDSEDTPNSATSYGPDRGKCQSSHFTGFPIVIHFTYTIGEMSVDASII